MTSRYAIVVIAADGATDIIGPYTSERRAQHNADAIHVLGEVSADVYLMDPPINYKEYTATE